MSIQNLNMRAVLLFFLFIGVNGYSQSFEVQKDEFPFYNILEWKGHGAVLLSKDPTEKSKKINLTLIGNPQKGNVTQSFNPKGKNFYYIASENTDYVYFIDNLQLENGKYYFSQLGANGILKTSSSVLSHLLTAVFKNIGDLNVDELQLVDIVTTEKALVHLFRYHNKKESKYTEIAIFMTHSNMISYACILGEIKETELNDPYKSHWKYIGSTGEKIFFSVRGYNKELKKGWLVSGYTPKAEMFQSSFYMNSDLKYEEIEDKGFGTTGRHYLNQKGETEPNILTYFNNAFYLTGIALVNGARELRTLKYKEEKWVLAFTYPLKPSGAKTITKFGVYPLNEGLGVQLEQSTFLTVVFLPFESSTGGTAVTLYSDKILFNPSRMFLKENKQDFGAKLPERKIFFSYTQLNNTGPVKFNVIENPK